MEVKMGPWAVGKCADVIDICTTGYRNLSPVELVLIDLRVFSIQLVFLGEETNGAKAWNRLP